VLKYTPYAYLHPLRGKDEKAAAQWPKGT